MTTTTATTFQKFNQLRTELNAVFPERSDIIDGVLTAVVAGEHVLMIGPPGTAKSAMVRAIASAFDGKYFERLMTKFSTPEELFGPVSLRALEQDRFERVTTKKLPEAEIAFVDEVFKSNSAILNSLLTIMNERLFHNDGQVVKCPLVSMFGASNELPEGKELEALYDRFMLRFNFQYLVKNSSLKSMLRNENMSVSVKLSMEELRSAQAEAALVTVSDETEQKLIEIREQLQQEGLFISDRRLKKSLRLVRAAAWLTGEKETIAEDLTMLADAFWHEPADRPKIAKALSALTDPASVEIQELMDSARELQKRMEAAKAAPDKSVFLSAAAKALQQIETLKERIAAAKNVPKAGRRSKKLAAEITQEVAEMEKDYCTFVMSAMKMNT